jgi:hypothetical protein
MVTFNKKTLIEQYKKTKTVKPQLEEEDLNELVNTDGSPIGGDSTGYNDVEVRVSPGQTTDDYAKSARQGPRPYFGYYGTAYSHGALRHIGVFQEEEEEGKEEEIVDEDTVIDGITVKEFTEDVNEVAKLKMKNLLEKVLDSKSSENDIVKKTIKDIKKEIKDIFDKHKDDKSEILLALTKLEKDLDE